MVMRPEFVAGFAVAEGCFTTTGEPARWAFTVALGARDGETCDAMAAFFGVGHVYRYPRRADHHDDVAIFTVQDRRSLVEVIVPFMDEYLPASRRRVQYERWRQELLAPRPYSPAAVRSGSSGTIDSQSMRAASDHRRSSS